MRKLHIGCINAQYMRKIVLLSPMHSIYCALEEEVQSCTNLAHILRVDTSNAQLAHLEQNTMSRSNMADTESFQSFF